MIVAAHKTAHLAVIDQHSGRLGTGAETLALRDFALLLKGAKAPAIKVPELDVRSVSVDLAGRNVRLGWLDLKGAAVSAVRLKDGSFDIVKALVPEPAPAGKGAKLTQEQFAARTGWGKRCNQHERDAAMVALQYLKATHV